MTLMDVVVLEGHGDIEQVAFAQIPIPEIGEGEVLVEVKAAALNRLDLWVVEGWSGLKLQFPHILGSDGAGVIAKVGARVEGFSPGDRVAVNPTLSCGECSFCVARKDNMCNEFALFGEHVPGFFGQYQTVPIRNLLPLPDHVSYERAAAASLVYVTAWHSLITVGKFRTGEDILVIGAGGGVNSACIDIARLAGARRILVVGSSEKKLNLARRLGATVTINRHETPWDKAVYQSTDGQGVDVVIDNVGSETFSKSLRALKKGGRLLTVGNSSGARFELDNRYVFGKHLSVLGSTMGPRQDFKTVMRLVFDGHLKPEIDSIFPLGEGPAALRQLEAGDVAGKLLLRP
jgi:NADPH:quinone reductase-like Zn-dependent oxidoreductase